MRRTLSLVCVYCLNDIPSKVELSVLLIYITRESKPYTVDEVEWWPHFSFLMPQNLKVTASLGHRCTRLQIMATTRKEKNMRKNFLMGILILLLLIYPLGAFPTTLEVSVTSAGNLVNQVDLTQIDKITNLTLHGELNGTDILVIRKMKGLEYLDMTDTKIVNGGDSYYDEYVTSEDVIGSYFFNNPNLITIYLPNTIKKIDEYAFDNFKGLKTVLIGNSTTNIEKYAFRGCGITIIEIPKSVTKIAEYAFSECRELENLIICGGRNHISISEKAFADCMIKEIYLGRNCSCYNSYYVQSPFYELDSLQNVLIGKQVSRIYDRAFSNCGLLKELKIEDSADSIEIESNFYESPIENLYLGRNIVESLERPFSDMETLKNVQIGDSVTRINKYAFSGCIGLNAIVIPDSVESIGQGAFSGCGELKDVRFGTSVKVIGSYAFSGCENIHSIVLPASVEIIGSQSFYGCSNLSSADLGKNIKRIGYSAFSRCVNLKAISIPDSVKSIDDFAFDGCTSLSSIVLGKSIVHIGDNAFRDCVGVIAVKIPQTVNYLSGFGGCVNLQEINIPNAVTQIGNNAFQNCAKLNTVTLPDSIYGIGNCSFEGCIGLTDITIPNSVTTIGYCAFKGCTGLSSIAIPNSVTRLESTFEDCSGLKNVVIEDGVNELEIYAVHSSYDSKDVFYNCPLEKVYIGRNLLYDRQFYAPKGCSFKNCTTLDSLVIGGNVTRIQNSFFSGCINLQFADIGNAVRQIGEQVFNGCANLQTVNIGSSVENIGNNAFSGCTNLTTINSLNPTPPSIEDESFMEATYNTATLYVPNGRKTIYWLHPYWENFYNIVEKDFPTTGIVENVFEKTDYGYRIDNYGITFTKENEGVRIYTSQGFLLYNGKSSIGQTINLSPNTVYIVKIGKQTTKVAF